jgi:hypothetical protein
MSPSLISFVINLFANRKLQIITTYGLSKCFQAGDGIDQRETISPLIWHIFYDPLLAQIQSNETLGYTLDVDWPVDNNNNSITEDSIRVACTAFADDTTWLASNRNQMIKIVNISNSFYALNDIKINSEKSELLVWNKKDKDTPAQITMGTDNVIVEANHLTKETRYLGIYLQIRAGNSHTIKRIKNEITSMCNLLRNKKVTTAQLVYMNNKVLLSRIEYWTKTTNISETLCKSLHNCYIKMVKHKMKIISTANNNIITH